MRPLSVLTLVHVLESNRQVTATYSCRNRCMLLQRPTTRFSRSFILSLTQYNVSIKTMSLNIFARTQSRTPHTPLPIE